METHRRDFLRTLSAAASLPAFASILRREAERIGRPYTNSADSKLRDVRNQFPLLREAVDGRPLVYLDSAATTQRPQAVLDALASFYLHDNANPSKSLHALARRSAALYDGARSTVARFLNARAPDEIIWTRGTTEAINLVASFWGGANLGRGDEVLVTVSDHYSSLIPWQLAARRAGATLRVWDVSDDGHLRLDQLDGLLSKRTKIVTFPHVSNASARSIPRRKSATGRTALGRLSSSTRRSRFRISSWMYEKSAAIFLHFQATRCAGRWASAFCGRGASFSMQCRRFRREAT